MRILLIFPILLIISTALFAAHVTHIKCYSGGRLIYTGDTSNIYYIDDKSFAFKDNHKGRDMFIWASECVIEN